MFVRLRGLLFRQMMTFVAILGIFYFSAFLAGFGSSNIHLQDEKNMFYGFAFSNLVLCLLYLIVRKKFRMLEVIVTVALTLTLYSLSYFYFFR